MIKIAGIVFIALILTVFLKGVNREISIFVTAAAVLLLFVTVSNDLFGVAKALTEISSSIPSTQPYIKLMLKILGISLLAQFVSDMCRDAGENALAVQSEIASKIIILILTLPLFESVINIVTGLLK